MSQNNIHAMETPKEALISNISYEGDSQRDLKKEKISYLLQNHICEETIITRCSIPMDFKFKNKITQ